MGLADNPSLKREDLKMIAVLAIPNPKQTEISSKNLARQRVQSMNSIVSLVTATSEDGYIMAIEHKRYHVYGLQFHPESYLSENGHDLLKNFLQIMVLGMNFHQ